MLTKNIEFKNFIKSKKYNSIERFLKNIKKKIFEKSDPFLFSLTSKYKNLFDENSIKRLKKYKNYTLIGIGGSSLGAKAIYSFLNNNIKKKFNFVDNIKFNKIPSNKKKNLNIIISKSGNTLETITNFNTLGNHKDCIFLTENKENYLREIASEMKKEIFKHQDYIGGRYSVLSETGMLPACLMGLDIKKFKRLDFLINDKNFVNQLILNVNGILNLYNNKKTNSIILNYDENSNDLFLWYQQLVAESLGKKSKGILPVISLMPKDNHSLMQLYLDGPKKSFFTFFNFFEKQSIKLDSKHILQSHNYLKKKNVSEILLSQKLATERVFKNKNIPFRSFEIKKRDEKTLGELFCFFILETILISKALKVNPFDQPAVELIKKETKKILI